MPSGAGGAALTGSGRTRAIPPGGPSAGGPRRPRAGPCGDAGMMQGIVGDMVEVAEVDDHVVPFREPGGVRDRVAVGRAGRPDRAILPRAGRA